MASHNHSQLHLQPAGEEQDYSSLCNRGELLDLNAKDFMLFFLVSKAKFFSTLLYISDDWKQLNASRVFIFFYFSQSVFKGSLNKNKLSNSKQ